MEILPTYVTIEQAKLLKGKGFDVRCENFYNQGSGFKLQSDSLIRTGSDVFYEAPAHWELIEWLEIKHRIYVYAFRYYGAWQYKIDDEIGSVEFSTGNGYSSRQEAYSSAFDYVLNNIL